VNAIRTERRTVHQGGMPGQSQLKITILRGAEQRQFTLQHWRTKREERGAFDRRQAGDGEPQGAIANALPECLGAEAGENLRLALRGTVRLPGRATERRRDND